MNFRELCLLHNTDKGGGARYAIAYPQFFKSFRTKPSFRLLEIGVYEGASLRLWEDYFKQPDARFWAIDIHEGCKQYADKLSRTEIFIGDQSDTEFLSEVLAATGGGFFDIIIDDGSHISRDQQITFNMLWTHVNANGLYVIEDVGTTFKKHKRTVEYSPRGWPTTLAWLLKMIVEGVKRPNIGRGSRTIPLLVSFFGQLCFIRKPDDRMSG